MRCHHPRRAEDNHMGDFFSPGDFLVLKPVILLILFGMGVMLTDLLLEKSNKYFNAVTALVGVGFAAIALGMIQSQMHRDGAGAYDAFHGAIVLDSFGIFFSWIFLISTAITILISVRYMEIEEENHGEHYA